MNTFSAIKYTLFLSAALLLVIPARAAALSDEELSRQLIKHVGESLARPLNKAMRCDVTRAIENYAEATPVTQTEFCAIPQPTGCKASAVAFVPGEQKIAVNISAVREAVSSKKISRDTLYAECGRALGMAVSQSIGGQQCADLISLSTNHSNKPSIKPWFYLVLYAEYTAIPESKTKGTIEDYIARTYPRRLAIPLKEGLAARPNYENGLLLHYVSAEIFAEAYAKVRKEDPKDEDRANRIMEWIYLCDVPEKFKQDMLEQYSPKWKDYKKDYEAFKEKLIVKKERERYFENCLDELTKYYCTLSGHEINAASQSALYAATIILGHKALYDEIYRFDHCLRNIVDEKTAETHAAELFQIVYRMRQLAADWDYDRPFELNKDTFLSGVDALKQEADINLDLLEMLVKIKPYLDETEIEDLSNGIAMSFMRLETADYYKNEYLKQMCTDTTVLARDLGWCLRLWNSASLLNQLIKKLTPDLLNSSYGKECTPPLPRKSEDAATVQ